LTVLLFALPALWLALFLFPPVFAGDRAQHGPVGIWKPPGPINRDGSATEYAHVQEKGEFRLAKLGGIAAARVFAALPFEPLVLALMLQGIAMALADQAVRFFPGTDYAGHGAEIMAAEADGITGYRAAEIARMRTNRDKRGQDVEAGLARWHWLARVIFMLGRW
jgi:hypothetical protein